MIYCQEWGCTQLLVGKLGHTGLGSFVDEVNTVCGEVPLEYEFEVLVRSEQHTVYFFMLIAVSSVRPQVFKHRNCGER